jgi:predicted nucleic acid-binding protein
MPRIVVVDTSVLSQFFRKTGPSAKLQAWFEQSLNDRLLISTITRYEMMSGLAMLPSRSIIDDFCEFLTGGGFGVVPVSTEIADIAGLKKAELLRQGRTLHIADLLIGSTAASMENSNISIATANEKDFDFWGIDLINPI